MIKNTLAIQGELKRRSRWKGNSMDDPPLHKRKKRRAFWGQKEASTIFNNLKINIKDEGLLFLGTSWHLTLLTCKIPLLRGKHLPASFYRPWRTYTLRGLSPSGKGWVEIRIHLEKRSAWHWCLDLILHPRCSKPGSHISSVEITWELVRKEASPVHPGNKWIRRWIFTSTPGHVYVQSSLRLLWVSGIQPLH